MCERYAKFNLNLQDQNRNPQRLNQRQNYQQGNNQNYHQNNQNYQGRDNQRQGIWVQRGQGRRGRARGGSGTFKGQTNQGVAKPKNTLKFESDYDFEQANTEFEELKSQLAKVIFI